MMIIIINIAWYDEVERKGRREGEREKFLVRKQGKKRDKKWWRRKRVKKNVFAFSRFSQSVSSVVMRMISRRMLLMMQVWNKNPREEGEWKREGVNSKKKCTKKQVVVKVRSYVFLIECLVGWCVFSCESSLIHSVFCMIIREEGERSEGKRRVKKKGKEETDRQQISTSSWCWWAGWWWWWWEEKERKRKRERKRKTWREK